MAVGPPYNPLFVGDVPPVPVMPFPPSYPPGFKVPEPQWRVTNPGTLLKPPPDPFLEQLLGAMRPESETSKMTVWMIWVTDGSDPSGTIWLEAAWDDDSVSTNREGWDEEVAAAFRKHGGNNVRITKSNVDFDKVQSAFEPVDV